MHITYTQNGEIREVFFGNINLSASDKMAIEIPSSTRINTSSFIDTSTGEIKNAEFGNKYIITELTKEESFDLEVL